MSLNSSREEIWPLANEQNKKEHTQIKIQGTERVEQEYTEGTGTLPQGKDGTMNPA